MSDPFLAEIRMFGGGFAPTQWALCNGAIMSIGQNSMLFTLLGTSFGGNGTTTFNLPNMLDSVPIGAGQGAGLSNYPIGTKVGTTSVILNNSQMPSHSHQMVANFNVGDKNTPTALTALARCNPGFVYAPDSGTAFNALDPSCFTGFTGNASPVPHNNIQPYLAVNFIIALQGVFPPRP